MWKTLNLSGLPLSRNKRKEWNHGVGRIFTVLEVPEEAASSGSSPGTLWHCKMKGNRNGEMADGSQITTQILFCGSSMMNSIASSMASAASTNFRVHTGVS